MKQSDRATKEEGQTMDHVCFDELTRTVGGGAGTRRAVFRMLAGSALTGVTARFGLSRVTAAKKKEHTKAKPRQKRKPQPQRKAHGQLQAEGKHKSKHHKKPKDPPPSGVCDNGHPRCPDGSCAIVGQCCPGSRLCSDGFCHKEEQCCP